MLSSFLKKVGAAASAAVAASGFPASASQVPLVIGGRTVRIRDQLGEGGYAFVYSVEDVNSGEILALKRMIAGDREQKAIAEQEIAIMKQLRDNEHIIQFLGACCKESQNGSRASEYYLLMEMGDGGSLIKEIQSKQAVGGRYSEREICRIFQQICLALDCLHSQNPPICHRDLKIENVLIHGSGRQREYKLCDFGSCTTRAQAYTTKEEILAEEERIQKFSTSMYRAPEMVDLYKREVINEKVDIWAAGCILFTLAYFTQPFQEGGTLQILSGNYEIPEHNPYSKYLTSLIKRLLTVQPAKRPDIKLVLKMVEHWAQWLKSGSKESVPSMVAAPAASQASLSAGSSSASASGAGAGAASAAGEGRPRKKSFNRDSNSENSEKHSKEKAEEKDRDREREKEGRKKKKDKSKELAAPRSRTASSATPPLPSPSPSNQDFAADWDPFAAGGAPPQARAQAQQLQMPAPNSTPLSAPSAAHSAANAPPRAPTAPAAAESVQPIKVAMLFDLGGMHPPMPPPPPPPGPPPPMPPTRSLSAGSSSSTPPAGSAAAASTSASAAAAVDGSSAFHSDEWAKFSPPPQRIVHQEEVEPGEDDWAAFESASFDTVKAMHTPPPGTAQHAESARGGERSPKAANGNQSDALAAAPGIFFAQHNQNTAATAAAAAVAAVASAPSKRKLKKVSSSAGRSGQ